MITDQNKQLANSSRRNFLKIGAGVVAGAAVASVAEIPYYTSAVNSNDSKIANLQSQLNSSNASLNSANSQISGLKNQLSSVQTQLTASTGQVSSLQSQLGSANTQVTSLKGELANASSQMTTANSPVTTLQGQLASSDTKVTTLQTSVSSYSEIADALTALNIQEAAVVSAAAATIIPTDSNGPGATEAGVIYFIDRQLNGDYGNNGRMYNQGPFVTPNTKGPITVDGITYSGGSPNTPWAAGQTYQYSMSLRNFWHYGILALEAYATSAYGGVFESLSAANQLACLQDLFNNKPTSFNSIIPSDFANELFFMVWSGFLMDPMYGGNRGMVGWTLTASPGLNNGNFYGEGQTPQKRMVASTPTKLKPASLAQFQQSSKIPGVLGGDLERCQP